MMRHFRPTQGRRALAIGLAIAVTAGSALAQQVIEDRIAGFRDIGSAFKNIGDELKSGRPNLTKVKTSARVIQGYSGHVLSWFPPNSKPPPKVAKNWFETLRDRFFPEPAMPGEPESHARIEIWTRSAQFKQSARSFEVAANEMWKASNGKDVAFIGAKFRKLGATCKGCHDAFREKMD